MNSMMHTHPLHPTGMHFCFCNKNLCSSFLASYHFTQIFSPRSRNGLTCFAMFARYERMYLCNSVHILTTKKSQQDRQGISHSYSSANRSIFSFPTACSKAHTHMFSIHVLQVKWGWPRLCISSESNTCTIVVIPLDEHHHSDSLCCTILFI